MSDKKPFLIQLSNGITIQGMATAAAYIAMFRDPSNLNAVAPEIPVGSAVTIVLPTAEIAATEFGQA
jgi:hypothetical protein